MKEIKTIYNLEKELDSSKFKMLKMKDVTRKIQEENCLYRCKIITYCLPDKTLVGSCVDEYLDSINLYDLTIPENLLLNYDLVITPNSPMPHYNMCINIAQYKANEIIASRYEDVIPIVNLIDQKWGNEINYITADIFSGYVEVDNHKEPFSILLLPNKEIIQGDAKIGEEYLETIAEIKRLKDLQDNTQDDGNSLEIRIKELEYKKNILIDISL